MTLTKISFSSKNPDFLLIMFLILITFSSQDETEMEGIWYFIMRDYGDAMKIL
jgi:hypothetical protein